MSNGDLFYVCGVTLAVSAVLVSFLGLRAKGFPGRMAPLVALYFIVLIGASTTFAVLHARDEQSAKAAELSRAGEEISEEESSPVPAEATGEGNGEREKAPKPEPAAKGKEGGGGGGTLQLEASPTQIAFDTTTLSTESGEVTIDFTNPAAIEHDVAIEQNGKVIAQSARITKGKTSVSADLAPGTYTFLCTVPGHAEAGMTGTLTVE